MVTHGLLSGGYRVSLRGEGGYSETSDSESKISSPLDFVFLSSAAAHPSITQSRKNHVHDQ